MNNNSNNAQNQGRTPTAGQPHGQTAQESRYAQHPASYIGNVASHTGRGGAAPSQSGVARGASYSNQLPSQMPRMQTGGTPAYAPQGAGAPSPGGGKNGNKKKRGIGFWIAIAVAIVAVVVAVFLAISMLGGEGASRRVGSEGQLEGKTLEEIQAELDRVVEEGMYNISIASTIAFKDGTSEGEVKIENVPGNRYLMDVAITRDDNGEVIYTSGILEPNHHIQFDTLDVDLDAGQYPATATFKALNPETEEVEGQAAAKVLIVVQE